MAENTDRAMEMQAMLRDGQQLNNASIVETSPQQASESTVVPIEQEVEGNSCCSR